MTGSSRSHDHALNSLLPQWLFLWNQRFRFRFSVNEVPRFSTMFKLWNKPHVCLLSKTNSLPEQSIPKGPEQSVPTSGGLSHRWIRRLFLQWDVEAPPSLFQLLPQEHQRTKGSGWRPQLEFPLAKSACGLVRPSTAPPLTFTRSADTTPGRRG